MADHSDQYELATVTSQDILPERQAGWNTFTRTATWAIAIIAVLLIALKVLFG
ncbi:preprotein translocase subunit SecE [Roseomonas sp. CCTCC AB2023176]|uniref:preprotein translocase subunit SecE n=1 Tax=Roseomonas sp. CCTCC AB2023176 TaxID=3342640 RepID=UPI0035E36EA8